MFNSNKHQVTSRIHNPNDLSKSREHIPLGYMVEYPVSASAAGGPFPHSDIGTP